MPFICFLCISSIFLLTIPTEMLRFRQEKMTKEKRARPRESPFLKRSYYSWGYKWNIYIRSILPKVVNIFLQK